MAIRFLPFVLLYFTLVAMLAWQDVRKGLLPDRFTCPLLWGGLLFHGLLLPERLPSSVFGAIAGYGALAMIYWFYRGVRHREGLGYGDVKFFAALGAWHGWQQLPVLITIATGLALLYVSGEAIALRSGEVLKNPLRFGPFLAAAGLVVGWQQWFTLRL